MRRYKILILSVLIFFILPLSAYGDTVDVLKFKDIETKISSKNRIITKNNDTYYNAVKSTKDGITSIDALITQWTTISNNFTLGVDGTLTGYNDAITYLLNLQKASLDLQKSNLTAKDLSIAMVQTEKGNNTIVWNMEMLFITYNSNVKQLEDLLAKKPLAEKKVEITKLQNQLGMTTDISVIEAEKDLLSIDNAIKLLTDANDNIIRQFNINLDQDLETKIIIEEVPEVKDSEVNSINVDEDYLGAVNRSYDIALADYKTDATRKFKSSFYSTYQTLLDKKKALEIEQKKMIVSEKKIAITEQKYKLGLISNIQYISEKSSYTTQTTALAIAKNSLAQAYRQYEWAKRGLIIATNAGLM